MNGGVDPKIVIPRQRRVEYSNYGQNRFPGDNFKQGSVTVSRGWEF